LLNKGSFGKLVVPASTNSFVYSFFVSTWMVCVSIYYFVYVVDRLTVRVNHLLQQKKTMRDFFFSEQLYSSGWLMCVPWGRARFNFFPKTVIIKSWFICRHTSVVQQRDLNSAARFS
jgi:hypothetical protein